MQDMTPSVLLVEDEPVVRLLVAEVLSEKGFSVAEPRNGAEALRVLGTGVRIHALFTDIDMPGGPNGFELARAVRERWPSVAILIVSGHLRPSPEEMPLGGFFISKPYEPTTVARQIRAALARSSTNLEREAE